MKLCFSTKHVNRDSFLDLCRLAYDYGMQGFEIHDAVTERRRHADSVLRVENSSEARRKLVNRGLQLAAVTYQESLHEDFRVHSLLQTVDMAAAAGTPAVILRLTERRDPDELRQLLAPAVQRAEQQGIELLWETSGYLAETERAVKLIRSFASPCMGVAWNIRDTYFEAGESAETGMKTLGAYIRYVRIGDRKDGRDVLLGEGDLPAADFVNALRSLNYDGFFCVDWNEEITDADIVLTHFGCFMGAFEEKTKQHASLETNRVGTGTFPWKKNEILDITFPKLLDTVAELYPDQCAFRYTSLDYTRSYSQFRKDVDRTAAAFLALGVRPGFHVAVWAGNVPEWFLAFWAAVKIGAVLVTVNTAYKTREIEYLLRQSDTHTLVMTKGFKDSDYAAIMRELLPELQGHKKGTPFYSDRLPFLRNVVTVGFETEGCLSWEDMLDMGEEISLEEVRRRAAQVKPEDVANMQYTSGTTGFPKGVMLTHRGIINNGKLIGDRMDLSTADRMLVQVPMFHCFGMVLTMTSVMTHGGTLCPLPYFSPQSALAAIRQEKITCMNGVPTMFVAMFGHPDFASTDFSRMRTGIMAGANCPPELMKRAAAEMHMTEILSVYGQTEASPGCTMGEVNEDLAHRCETVGTAFPGVECRIIDPETGAEKPDGEDGEFVARGFNIMKGYYKMPEATARTVDRDGWLHSGDICRRDAEGYYRVTGRLKDMIIRGGENIYPREIEEFYLTHPKVRDVQVIGVPDPAYGEEICAWIILNDNEQADAKEMKAFGTASIARHKVPRYFVFVEKFPMNAAGKVLKYKMKEEFSKMQKREAK